MSTTVVEDYVAKRAELLANLVLTRQKGVVVFRFQDPEDAGMHLLATLPSIGGVDTGLPVLPRIGVEVLGTEESLKTEADATAYVRKDRRDRQGFFLGPIVLLLFSMEGDAGYFGWIMEPRVSKSEGPTLTRVVAPAMTKITKTSTEVIFRESETWYAATVQLLLRDKK
jgi:hypothetical protein